MPSALELIGRRFGRLLVIKQNPVRALIGAIRWDCICDCGNQTTVVGSTLVNNSTKSCGCFNREKVTTHGMHSSPEYQSWRSMIQRCINPNANAYSDYGGRGITVCDRWLNSFEAFYEDMGPRPSLSHSIDRKENDKGYYRDNCFWATKVEQANNRRSNVLYEYRGDHYSIKQLLELPESKVNRICESTLRSRIWQGCSIEDAINKPIKK